MQYQQHVVKQKPVWSQERMRGFETRVRNAWGDKQKLGMMSDKGNPAATRTILRNRWLDTYRQDDASYGFFMQNARQGQPFRNRKRPYRVSQF